MKNFLLLFISILSYSLVYGQCNVPVTNLFVNICDSDTFTTAGNQNVMTSGIYLDTLQSVLNCDSVIETTLTVNPRTTDFNYAGAISFCKGDTNPSATITGVPGGKFTASGGLVIDSVTGAIDLSSAILGSYDVTYTPPLVAQQMGQDIDGETAGDQSGYSVSMSSDGLTVAIGAITNDGNGNDAGHVRVYSFNGTAWTQVGQDIDGEAAGDEGGNSVSMSSDGSMVAIGAYRNDGNGQQAGHVRIYSYNGTTWTQVGQDIDGEANGDLSGYSVSMSSDGLTLAIGAYANDGNGSYAGHVRIYSYNGTAWTKVGQDIDGEATSDESGYSLSMSSDGLTVAIGAPYNNGNGSNAGHVRVYSFNGTAWTQVGQDIDGEAAGDGSGYSVSMSSDGSTVAIGAAYNAGNGSGAGHVRVFSYNGTSWTQVGLDIDSEAAGDYSGSSVSMSSDGSTLAIAATGNDGNGNDAGHVRIYSYNGTAWTKVGQDIDGEASYDYSGYSVSMSSDGLTIAIGASDNDGNGQQAGHVRVFSLNAICPLPLSILINPTHFTQVFDTICGNSTFTTVGGKTVNAPGVYLDTLQSALSCDSVIETTLTVNPAYLTQVSATICDDSTYTFNGNSYTQTGVYLDTLHSALSCDSIIETNLTVNPTYYTQVYDTVCAFGTFTTIGGKLIQSEGSYFDTFSTTLGCDSSFETIVYFKKFNKDLSSVGGGLQSDDSTSSYQWLSCDIAFGYAIIASANSRFYLPTLDGRYSVELTKGGCVDTSNCYLFQSASVLEGSADENIILLYPNPTNGIVTIDAKQFQKAEVFDATGRLMLTSKSNIIDLKRQATGLYLIKVHTKGIIEEFKVLRE